MNPEPAFVTGTFTEYGTEPLIERLRRSTIGRYDVYAELGSGGMASVFLALDLALDRKVAIKVMSPALASSADAIERFRREARVAAALSHPNIIGIHAVGEDPELAYYVMKFIEGRSLDSVIRDEGKQSIPFTQAIIQYAGTALAYAHARGVVHRDVKPANFMLDMDGWLVVTDFGIAKMDDAKGLTMSGTLVGTPYYMSPEQFDGSPITGAADQYALGVVAYEMLTGQTPFNATSLGEVMKGHLLDPPPPLRLLRPDVPMEMEACIQKMLAKKPAERFPSLTDAVHAFGSILPADERQIRTQIITLAKSGALLQPRMSVPVSPTPQRNPTAAQRRTAAARPVPVQTAKATPKNSSATRRAFFGALLTVVVSAGVVYVARPDFFAPLLGMRASTESMPDATGPAPAVITPSVPPTTEVVTQAPDTAKPPAPTTPPAGTSTRPQASTPTNTLPATLPATRPPATRPSTPPATREPARTEPATTQSSQPQVPPSTVTPAPVVTQPPAETPARQDPVPEPAPVVPTGPGTIVLRSNAEGAALYVNNIFNRVIGAQGLQRIQLPAGEHRLSIRIEGCATTWDTTLTVRAEAISSIGNRVPRC